MTTMDERDQDRLELLDRIADRVPELDLDREQVEWIELPDGVEALSVNGGGIDGGDGTHFVNYADDLHAIGSLDPVIPDHVGLVVIQPDGSRHLARAVPDPLAHQPKPD
jgi:hypothetical protein